MRRVGDPVKILNLSRLPLQRILLGAISDSFEYDGVTACSNRDSLSVLALAISALDLRIREDLPFHNDARTLQ